MKHYRLKAEFAHLDLEEALRQRILIAMNQMQATAGSLRPSRLPGVLADIFEEVTPKEERRA